MATQRNLKIALVGAGSVQFSVGLLHDLALNEAIRQKSNLTIHLMDVVPENMQQTYDYAIELKEHLDLPYEIQQTLDLDEALDNADFVLTMIEAGRYAYWSQDFHIPRNYGSTQIYGENGGTGAMFHALRNFGPLLHVAQTMERLCPDALLINFANPEAKIVEALNKLTSIKVVGLCHGVTMGVDQVAEFLDRDPSSIAVESGGLNHFAFMTKIEDAQTGEDLYPLLREKEAEANPWGHFDHIGLSRTMFHIYGLYPYPGTNHCGEYISWANDFFAGESLLYRYEPVKEKLWEPGSRLAEFNYAATGELVDGPVWGHHKTQDEWARENFSFDSERIQLSGEFAIPIIEAMVFDKLTLISAVNVANGGAIAGLPDETVVETQAYVDGTGIRLRPMTVPLPTASIGMMHIVASVQALLVEAFQEQSKTKLLQAILLDANAPTYYQACALIDDMCERQRAVLPQLEWK